MLKDFIAKYDIDKEALSRIRHRLFLVGRFNQHKKGDPYPECWLFTNRNDLSETYRKNFTDVRDLRYESFVQCLNPALAEKVEYEGDNPATAIPKIRQKVPRGGEKKVAGGEDYAEGTAVVDVFNYLFQRAVSSTFQEAFGSSRPALPSELDKVGGKHAGSSIFWLIRRNLRVFSSFQPRTHEIVNAIGRLFALCSRENGMPSYAAGDALPAGFPERLIDFVYAEDSRLPFSAEGLDFSSAGRWGELVGDNEKIEMFCNVVTAFRDALLGLKREQFGFLYFRGQTLNYQARDVVPADLARDFVAARESFNGLRQVLRSKALISMVLDWVLAAFYELEEVKALGPNAEEVDRDEAVENLVLTGKKNKVAAPIPRPSLEERETFSKDLTTNFERLLLALVGSAETREKSFAGLPTNLQSLVRELRDKYPERVEALAGIASPEMDNSARKAFIESSKIILLDILCPTLFQQPILSEDMLRALFRQDTMSVYLTAVFLENKTKDAVRFIGEKHLDYFQSKIKSQKITDSTEIQERLLSDFIELISSKEVQRRMKEGLRVLREARTILDNAPPGLSAGSISAVRPDPELKKSGTLEKTEIKSADLSTSIRTIVRVAVDSKVAKAKDPKTAATANKPQAQTSSAHAGSTGTGTGASTTTAEAPSPFPTQDIFGQSEIERDVTKKVEDVISGFFEKNKKTEIGREDVSAIVDQATEELFIDDRFMGRVRKDVRAFEQALFLIYQRYNENPDKKNFRNRVERLTLINAMMLFRKELMLGTVSSNLYHLLIDMVEDLDGENPDLGKFIKEKSLTRYFDNVKLERGGVTNLRKTLEAQAYENLRETVDFVSELWGVKYLMDSVASTPQAEVVVINATANEFLDWLDADNLIDVAKGKGRLRSGFLVTANNQSEGRIQPGLVYLTDAAFGKDGDPKSSFLLKLKKTKLSSGRHSMLLPPMCIGTRALDGGNAWQSDGLRWAAAAAGVRAPVVIVGPSAFLNSPEDHFRTNLPAGYLFATHFLGCPDQALKIENVSAASATRFRVIGYGAFMRESLDSVLWPENANDHYGFSVDYYLYIVLILLATARFGGRPLSDQDVDEFYEYFHRPRTAREKWMSSDVINDALIGENALDFSMSSLLTRAAPVQSVLVDQTGLSDTRNATTVDDVGWFNVVRQEGGLN
jgi:hypothetical protein